MRRSDRRRHTFPYGTDLPSYVVSFKQASGPFSTVLPQLLYAKGVGRFFPPQATISRGSYGYICWDESAPHSGALILWVLREKSP